MGEEKDINDVTIYKELNLGLSSHCEEALHLCMLVSEANFWRIRTLLLLPSESLFT